jgi:hypothetical protein
MPRLTRSTLAGWLRVEGYDRQPEVTPRNKPSSQLGAIATFTPPPGSSVPIHIRIWPFSLDSRQHHTMNPRKSSSKITRHQHSLSRHLMNKGNEEMRNITFQLNPRFKAWWKSGRVLAFIWLNSVWVSSNIAVSMI